MRLECRECRKSEVGTADEDLKKSLSGKSRGNTICDVRLTVRSAICITLSIPTSDMACRCGMESGNVTSMDMMEHMKNEDMDTVTAGDW